MRVFVINCGSSTLKFDLIDVDSAGTSSAIGGGLIEGFGDDARCVLETPQGRSEHRGRIAGYSEGLSAALALLANAGVRGRIDAVGHRVVHGGAILTRAVLIDDAVLAAIEEASRLAPLHNRPAIQAIGAARDAFPDTPMVASFDTAFLASLPAVARTYALPASVRYRYGIRRFGFHGLAHRYMVERYRAMRPDVVRPRLISLQLGNGCSATASVNGVAVDTSMGLTPLEGLVMGTRSGDIDPSIPVLLANQGIPASEIDRILNRESGLLGLSGVSSDMRAVEAAAADGNPDASFALEAFCYRARKYIGAYLAVLGGADALLFGGGIGEHSAEVRRRICAGFEWAGLTLDEAANNAAAGDYCISSGSGTEAWVIGVREAEVIAADTAACLST
jgi:acetate kinase